MKRSNRNPPPQAKQRSLARVHDDIRSGTAIFRGLLEGDNGIRGLFLWA